MRSLVNETETPKISVAFFTIYLWAVSNLNVHSSALTRQKENKSNDALAWECGIYILANLKEIGNRSEGYSSEGDLGWLCFHSFLGHTDRQPRDSFEICWRSRHMPYGIEFHTPLLLVAKNSHQK